MNNNHDKAIKVFDAVSKIVNDLGDPFEADTFGWSSISVESTLNWYQIERISKNNFYVQFISGHLIISDRRD